MRQGFGTLLSFISLGLLLVVGCSGGDTETEYVPTPTDAKISVEEPDGTDLNGGTLALGTATAGANGTAATFYVRNLGGSQLVGAAGGNLDIQVTGTDAAQFHVTPTSLAPLNSGETIAVTAQIQPTGTQTSGALTATVTVYSADGTNPTVSFTLTGSILAPVITAVSPAIGHYLGGTSITVTGAGFQSDATVTVGGTSATGVSVNTAGTEITCTTPAGTVGLADVVVTNGNTDTDTLSNGYRNDLELVFQREDDQGIVNLYGVMPHVGVSSERALTSYTTNDNLNADNSTGHWTVYLRGTAVQEYYAIDHNNPGTPIPLTHRNNGYMKTLVGITNETVPRVLFLETVTGSHYLYSARVDGSDYSTPTYGAVRVSAHDIYASGSNPILITNEATPNVVYVDNGASPRRVCSALVDGTQYGGNEVTLDDGSSSGAVNIQYLVGLAQQATGENAPRAIYRCAATGNDLFSAQVASSVTGTRLTTGTTTDPSAYEGVTKEATPRVIFTRDDGSAVEQIWSVPVTGGTATQITSSATFTSDVTALHETDYGGFIGSATLPHILFEALDGSGTTQIYSVVADGSAAATMLSSSSSSTNCTYRGILPGTTDRVFWSREDTNGNVQIHMANIDGTGSITQITSGTGLGGTEDSTMYGIVDSRWVITRREENGSTYGQVFSYDLNATSNHETQLTTYDLTTNQVVFPGYQDDNWLFNSNTGIAAVLLQRVDTGGNTHFFGVPCDGSATAYRLSNSMSNSGIAGGIYQ